MNKLIAVQGCTIEYDLPDDSAGSVSLTTSVSQASGKVKAGNKQAYKDKITITVSNGDVTLSSPPEGATSPSGTVTPGSITISSTSEKTHTEGDDFVLENDDGESSFVCIFPGPNGSQVPSNVKIRATVTDSGQNVTKAT